MKRTRLVLAAFAAAACLALAVLACAASAFYGGTAYAESVGRLAGTYSLSRLEAYYKISSDGYAEVTETITVSYAGASQIVRELPGGKGERVRSVSVSLLDDKGFAGSVEYNVETENGKPEIIIDDDSAKIGECTYVIKYVYYNLSAAQGEIVFTASEGWGAEVAETFVTIELPYAPDPDCTVVSAGENAISLEGAIDGNIITFSYSGSSYVAFASSEGKIAAYKDDTGYYALIASAALLVALIAVKMLFFNKHKLRKEANAKAAEDMDPLLMGKLIDNKANDCDVASLIFYWANNGYIKIDMSDPQTPVLTKVSNLPAMAPEYEQKLFYRMFRKKTTVRVGEAGGTGYYKTAESVKKCVDEKARGSYSSAGIGCSVLFALLGGLTLGLYPALYAACLISSTYAYLTGFVFLLPALIVYGITETLLYNRYKFGTAVKLMYAALIIAVCAGATAAYAILVPDFIIDVIPKILISISAYAVVVCSTMLIGRTESYNRKLGEILGFRKFILSVTEPDVRDMMKDTPDLFFILYPYSVVLNLDEVWANKFSSTRMTSPAWRENCGETINGSQEIYSSMKTACSKFISTFVARPSEDSEKPKRR